MIEKSGCSRRGKPAPTESRYPTYGACWVSECFQIHRTLTWTTESLTCAQMLMHAIAHGGVRTHVRECALKFDSGIKIPCRTGESNLPQRRAGPTLYQLSYIPAPLFWTTRSSCYDGLCQVLCQKIMLRMGDNGNRCICHALTLSLFFGADDKSLSRIATCIATEFLIQREHLARHSYIIAHAKL